MELLGKLKLNQLSKSELEQGSMRVLKGGRRCGCEDACKADNGSFNNYGHF
jgi:natural product precursor